MATTRHIATALAEALFDTMDGFFTITYRITEITPSIPAREGKTLDTAFTRNVLQQIYGLDSFKDDELFAKIIGGKRKIQFQTEEVEGTLKPSGVRLLGRVLTIKDKVATTKPDITPSTSPHDAATQPPSAADAEVIPPCAYCESRKALTIGATCSHCWSHMIGDDTYIIVPVESRGNITETAAAFAGHGNNG